MMMAHLGLGCSTCPGLFVTFPQQVKAYCILYFLVWGGLAEIQIIPYFDGMKESQALSVAQFGIGCCSRF